MIDLETLGTKPGCVILEIGIVCNFPSPNHPDDGDWQGSLPVKIERQSDLTADPDTIAWWMRHPDAWARVSANQTTAVFPEDMCRQINWMLRMCDEVWANSPSFDCNILSDFMDRYSDTGLSWESYQERDFRTAKALTPGIDYVAPENAHGALADAIAQANHLDKLGIWRS